MSPEQIYISALDHEHIVGHYSAESPLEQHSGPVTVIILGIQLAANQSTHASRNNNPAFGEREVVCTWAKQRLWALKSLASALQTTPPTQPIDITFSFEDQTRPIGKGVTQDNRKLYAARLRKILTTCIKQLSRVDTDGSCEVQTIPNEEAVNNHNTSRDLARLLSKPCIIAFYLPQYHPIPENDLWWGPGFTDWINVAKARKLFSNHDQPRVPADVGYYDLRTPETRHQQEKLARLHGLSGFCYYYYWFSGRRILERPLDDRMGDASSTFPFCICWANENWTKRWDGGNNEILIEQHYDRSTPQLLAENLAPILTHKDYLRISNRPLFIIYRLDTIPDPSVFITSLRMEISRLIGVNPYIIAARTFNYQANHEAGVDAELDFPPHSLQLPKYKYPDDCDSDFQGTVYDYEDALEASIRPFKTTIPRFRGCMLAWDNTARKSNQATIFRNYSPDLFQEWLCSSILATLEDESVPEPLIFINAWNEWAEGSYLEPDKSNGASALEAVKLLSGGFRSEVRTLVHKAINRLEAPDEHAVVKRIDLLAALHQGSLPALSMSSMASRRDLTVQALHSTSNLLQKITSDVQAFFVGRKIALTVRTAFEAEDPPGLGWELCDDFGLLGQGLTKPARQLKGHLAQQSSRHRVKSSVTLSAAIPCRQVRLYIVAPSGPIELLRISVNVRHDHQLADNAKARLSSQQLQLVAEAEHRLVRHARICFVVHDPYPGGAQLWALSAIKALKLYLPDATFTILLCVRDDQANSFTKAGKALLALFRECGDVLFLNNFTLNTSNNQDLANYDLIYVNSVASLKHAIALRLPLQKSIIHVHELGGACSTLVDDSTVTRIQSLQPHFIACSQSVKTFVIDRFGLNDCNVSLIYPTTTSNHLIRERLATAAKSTSFKLPAEPYILIVGSITHRKGSHLLPVVAATFKSMYGFCPVFVWAGSPDTHETQRNLLNDFAKCGLSERLHLLGQQFELTGLYKGANCLLLLSIEDPFPLVLLEAGQNELPVVGFKESGGVSEYCAKGGGIAVTIFDINGACKAISLLLSDKNHISKSNISEAVRYFNHEKMMSNLATLVTKQILETRPR